MNIVKRLAGIDPRALSAALSKRKTLGLSPAEAAKFSSNLALLAGHSGARYLRPNLSWTLPGERGQELARRAGQITIEGFKSIQNLIQPGMTELEVAQVFEKTVKSLGAGISYRTTVLTGSHAALVFSKTGAHVESTNRRIQPGEMVLIDAAAAVEFSRKAGGQLISSDMTRTFAMGEISPLQREIYGIVRRAQRAAMTRVRANVFAGEIDKTARDIITAAGYGDNFVHATGHGIGIADLDNISAQPWLTLHSLGVLRAGDVLAVEPGIYVGREMKNGSVRRVRIGNELFAGGVRIEDTLLVTDRGHEVLTEFPRSLSAMTIPLPCWT